MRANCVVDRENTSLSERHVSSACGGHLDSSGLRRNFRLSDHVGRPPTPSRLVKAGAQSETKISLGGNGVLHMQTWVFACKARRKKTRPKDVCLATIGQQREGEGGLSSATTIGCRLPLSIPRSRCLVPLGQRGSWGSCLRTPFASHTRPILPFILDASEQYAEPGSSPFLHELVSRFTSQTASRTYHLCTLCVICPFFVYIFCFSLFFLMFFSPEQDD